MHRERKIQVLEVENRADKQEIGELTEAVLSSDTAVLLIENKQLAERLEQLEKK